MDPLDSVFATLRVQSALYARLEVSAPWGINFAGGQGARFGLVTRGRCWMTVEGMDEGIALNHGDCYVLIHGSAYALRDDLKSPTRNCFDVIKSRSGGVVDLGGGGVASSVITGWFTFDSLGARPLMQLLPRLLHTRMEDARTKVMQSTLELLNLETAEQGLGSGVIISRLADILFVQAIRNHVASNNAGGTGWLAALADPRLGPALRAIHHDATHPWTVELLASTAGMSRSAFAARFNMLVGESPIEHLTRWRMFRAGALLRQTDQPLSLISHAVGYDSAAAFSKAFKRINGLTPRDYRWTHGKDEDAKGRPARSRTVAA